MSNQKPKIVICGTDTDVGKTIVSALIVQGLNAIYWKPVQSGLENNGDTGRVCEILNLPKSRWICEAYKFKAAVSPHWAAEQEGEIVNPKRLALPSLNQSLVIETAGGLMVPLTRRLLQIEQLVTWQLPVVLVARSGLGTINHTLLSLEALANRKIPVLGIFLNGPNHSDNPKTIEQISGIPVIGHLPPLREITAKALSEQWRQQNLRAKFELLLKESTTNF